jgi:hydrogenase maturation protease
VIGIGNEFRTDDALGILVARQLKDSVPAGVQVVEASGEGAALMEAWKGAETAIIVDVVRSGAAPGSLHHIELSDRDLHYNILPFSSHAFGVTEAVATARILGQAPPRMVLLGIEGASFVYGTSLSDAVVRGLPLLLGEIERELHTGGTA